jgi:glycosyltransferase involved in cell wall biosynthesis
MALFYILNLFFIWLCVLRIVVKKKIRVVVTTNPIAAFPLFKLKRFLGISTIFDYVDDLVGLMSQYIPATLASPASRVVERIVASSLCHSNLVIASSTPLLESALKQTDASAVLIPNGVDVERFRITDARPSRGPVVGYVGGIYEWSGVEDFLSTIDDVERIIPDVEYHVYGSGSSADTVSSLADNHNRVFFHGEIQYSDVPAVMKSFDVGVIPFVKSALTDAACPLKLFEYWAAGAVVVSRNLIDVSLIAKGSALYFETGEEFSEQIIRALSIREESKRIREAALVKVQEFDWMLISQKYHKLISQYCDINQ